MESVDIDGKVERKIIFSIFDSVVPNLFNSQLLWKCPLLSEVNPEAKTFGVAVLVSTRQHQYYMQVFIDVGKEPLPSSLLLLNFLRLHDGDDVLLLLRKN